MDAAYAGSAGADGIGERWLVSVPLLPGELVSSWLIRVAFAHGCDPPAVTSFVWPQRRAWALDIDRFVTRSHLEVLSFYSGIPLVSFQEATLRPIASRIHKGRLTQAMIWPWILSLGTRRTDQGGGLQYCPRCLQEDEKPYYRLRWRLAWHTCCEKHDCFLLDRCWRCGSTIRPGRLAVEDRKLSACVFCKADLAAAEREAPVFAGAMEFQRMADKVLANDCGDLFGETVSAHDWFQAANFLVALLRKRGRISQGGLVRFMDHLGVHCPQGLPVIAGVGPEKLGAGPRRKIFGPLWSIVSSERELLINAMVESGVSRQVLGLNKASVPVAFAELFENLPLPVKYLAKSTRRKWLMPWPRPRHEVIRKIDRLKRKLAATGGR